MAQNEARLSALRGIRDFGRQGSAEELQRLLEEESALEEVPGVAYEDLEGDVEVPLEEDIILAEDGTPVEADVLSLEVDDPLGGGEELTPEELAELEELLELEAARG